MSPLCYFILETEITQPILDSRRGFENTGNWKQQLPKSCIITPPHRSLHGSLLSWWPCRQELGLAPSFTVNPNRIKSINDPFVSSLPASTKRNALFIDNLSPLSFCVLSIVWTIWVLRCHAEGDVSGSDVKWLHCHRILMRLKTTSGSSSRLLFELQPPFLMALNWLTLAESWLNLCSLHLGTCHLPLVYLTNILPDTKTSFGITGSVSMSSILSHTIFDILLYSHILSLIITTDKIRLTPKSHSHIFTWLGLLFTIWGTRSLGNGFQCLFLYPQNSV